MICINKNLGQVLNKESVGNAVEVTIVGLLTQSEFDYIRKSNVKYLDLTDLDLQLAGNETRNYDERQINSFSEFNNLEQIKLPDKLTKIANWAFWSCKKLKRIIIPNTVRSIGCWAFSHCESLESVDIPPSIIEINEGAFAHCHALLYLNVPHNVTIHNTAFYNCKTKTCRCEIVFCECGRSYPQNIMSDEHKSVKCECGLEIKRCCMDTHKKNADEHKMVNCSCCGRSYQGYQENDHEISSCEHCMKNFCTSQSEIHALLKCQLCGEEKGKYIIDEHSRKCKRPISCKHEDDGCCYVLPYNLDKNLIEDFMRIHLSYFCLFEKTVETAAYQYCPFIKKGCYFETTLECNTPELAKRRMAEHLHNSCCYMYKPCENAYRGCNEFIIRKEYDSHIETCMFARIKCEICKETINRPNITDHILYECKGTHCRNAKNLCNFFSLDKKELYNHMNECQLNAK